MHFRPKLAITVKKNKNSSKIKTLKEKTNYIIQPPKKFQMIKALVKLDMLHTKYDNIILQATFEKPAIFAAIKAVEK